MKSYRVVKLSTLALFFVCMIASQFSFLIRRTFNGIVADGPAGYTSEVVDNLSIVFLGTDKSVGYTRIGSGKRLNTASDSVAICTTEELDRLFFLARHNGTSGTDAMEGVDYLKHEDPVLRQYVRFTFGTAIFVQSKTRKTGSGLDEIDHWVVITGLDGHLVSARHDQIVEKNYDVVNIKELPNENMDGIKIARDIIERFLGNFVAI